MPKWTETTLVSVCCLLLSATVAAQQQLGFVVVDSYPHDRNAFTQGLLYFDGKLYESTGRYGYSELREVELETGRVLRKQKLPRSDFGEGLARVDQQLVQLTWTSGHAYLWDLPSFTEQATIPYAFSSEGKPPRGWGLCFNGRELVLSDGSATLYFLKPDDHSVIRTLSVRDTGGAVDKLNELECIDGQVYANIWLSDRIVVINADTGHVTAEADLGSLYPRAKRRSSNHVMNGIAWDPVGKRLFVTGKNWPRLYHIALESAFD